MPPRFLEIRWHGRGGQGAVTASQLLVAAAVAEGKYGVAVPFFGAERRGAPVLAYTRISDKPIYTRAPIRNPDIVVVLDDKLPYIVDVTAGLKEGGVIVLNGTEEVAKYVASKGSGKFKVYYVNATKIAVEERLTAGGLYLTNTIMLAALAKATGIVKKESVLKAIEENLPARVVERNIRAAEKGYSQVVEYVG